MEDLKEKIGRGRIWTETEIKFLKDNYPKMMAKEIAEKLGRSLSSVRNMIYKLGLRKSVCYRCQIKEKCELYNKVDRCPLTRWQRYYRAHREEILKRHKEWVRKNREKVRMWQREYRKRNRERILERQKQYRAKHREKLRRLRKERKEKLKLEVLKHYSKSDPPRCVRCGFSDIRALTIDHIDGSGNIQRKQLHNKGGYHFYLWLKKQGYPEGYQVLCMNCQWIKRWEQDEKCHRSG